METVRIKLGLPTIVSLFQDTRFQIIFSTALTMKRIDPDQFIDGMVIQTLDPLYNLTASVK